MTTPIQGAVRNKHEMILPYHIFQALDWSAVMLSLLPKGKTGHGRP